MTLRLLVCILLSALTAAGATARPTTSDTTVSFVTVYPGHEIYELEGHSALRITTPAADMAVSYGMFDFNAPNFVYRFVKGETDYCVGLIPWPLFVQSYREEGRRVVEQTLNLTPDEKSRLIGLLAENLRPENRVYRYNYVLDNCATRPLGIVERATGSTIALGRPAADSAATATFRRAMRHFHRNYPWYQFGIDLALGCGIDRRVDSRAMSFAPVLLASQLTEATVGGGRKLVGDSTVVVDLAPSACVDPPTPWWLTPLAVFWLLAAVTAVVCAVDLRRGRVSRWLHCLIYGALGLTGCVLAFLIFVSVHEATSPNLLFLWINPGCLIPAIGIWLKKCKKLVLYYQIVNFALIIAGAVVFAMLPDRMNAAFVPVMLADAMLSATYMAIGFRHRGKKPASASLHD